MISKYTLKACWNVINKNTNERRRLTHVGPIHGLVYVWDVDIFPSYNRKYPRGHYFYSNTKADMC